MKDNRIPKKVFAIYGTSTVIDATRYIAMAVEECEKWRPADCGLNWTRQDLLTFVSECLNHRRPFYVEGKKWIILELNELLVED